MLELESDRVIIPPAMLEKLRCFICKGYLSCSPLRLAQDGSCICGSCSPLNSGTPVYRELMLEEMLKKTSFPCRFKEHGCTESVLFDKAGDHQYKCMYRPLPCPLLKTCSWKGSPSKLYNHFAEQHDDLIKEKAEFNFQVDQNAEGVLITVEDSLIFIIKYKYNASETNLKYNMFCTNKIGRDVSFKSQLINASDTDCSVNLKTNKCSLYDENFYEMQDAILLNINKMLPSLGDADSITVALKLKIVKSNNVSEKVENDCNFVNFDLINSLKCYSCNNYLVPPLFELDGCAVCCDCGTDNDNCMPSTDAYLLNRVNEAVYPCHWSDCNFVASSGNIKAHERACQFRLYNCIFECKDTFKLPELIKHIEKNHGICYSDKAVYTTSFSKNYSWKNVFTIIGSVPILIQQDMECCAPPTPGMHGIKLFSSPGDSVKIMVTLNFEHHHCKLKSQEFVVKEYHTKYIDFEELPRCFKRTDELTVNVKLNTE